MPTDTAKVEYGGRTKGTTIIQPSQEGIPLTRSPDLLLVMNTPKGRGVFASRPIPAKTILEVSPVLVLDPIENEEHVRRTNLYNYTYNWPYTPGRSQASPANNDDDDKPDSSNDDKEDGSSNSIAPPARLASTKTTQALILGLGSMFNHSTLHQNVGWERDLQNLLITYRTLRDVREGEELCISYGDGARLTFRDVDVNAVVGGKEDEEGWEEELLKTGIIDLID